MLSTLPNGGYAFPHPVVEKGGWSETDCGGMTLRDFMAAAALQGMIASAPTQMDRFKIDKNVWAGVAYGFADAMLKARQSG